MVKNPPYVRYERMRGDDPQDVGLGLILELKEKGVEVFVMGTIPDESYPDNCSIVRYYPKGRHDLASYTYYGPTAINFFLSKVLPRIKAQPSRVPDSHMLHPEH